MEFNVSLPMHPIGERFPDFSQFSYCNCPLEPQYRNLPATISSKFRLNATLWCRVEAQKFPGGVFSLSTVGPQRAMQRCVWVWRSLSQTELCRGRPVIICAQRLPHPENTVLPKRFLPYLDTRKSDLDETWWKVVPRVPASMLGGSKENTQGQPRTIWKPNPYQGAQEEESE